jgi:hypothetical protein
MLDLNSLVEVAYLRHQEDLKIAEAERLFNQIKGSQPSLFQRAGDFLIVARQWLKNQTSLPPTHPAFSKK